MEGATTAVPAAPPSVGDVRRPEAPVDARFVSRWSPRAYDERPVPREVVRSLVEAARWAPSSRNEQPWRFHVATRGPGRDRLDAAVRPSNRAWSDRAPVLVFVTARRTHVRDGSPNRHAWFDTGAATMQLVLQAQQHGLVARTMGGIEHDLAHDLLGLPDDEDVVCALALGHPGDPASLPEPLRQRERPSPRRPLADVLVEVP